MIAVQQQIIDFDLRDQILVVDGARGTRRILSTLLERKLGDVEVVTAASATEAVSLLNSRRFSLITTALALPDKDGIAFAGDVHAHEAHADTPVIVVSGDASRHTGARYYGKGVTAFFDHSKGYRRLVDYLRWLSSGSYHSCGRILCASHDADNRFSDSWQQLAQCEFNVLQASDFRDVVATLRSTLVEPVSSFDLLVIETNEELLDQSFELIFQIRHDLHLTPQALPILAAVSGAVSNEQLEKFFEVGCNDFIPLPTVDAVLAARIHSLLTIGQQYRILSKS